MIFWRQRTGPVLERVAMVLKSDPMATAAIEGHTDGKGDGVAPALVADQHRPDLQIALDHAGTIAPAEAIEQLERRSVEATESLLLDAARSCAASTPR